MAPRSLAQRKRRHTAHVHQMTARRVAGAQGGAHLARGDIRDGHVPLCRALSAQQTASPHHQLLDGQCKREREPPCDETGAHPCLAGAAAGDHHAAVRPAAGAHGLERDDVAGAHGELVAARRCRCRARHVQEPRTMAQHVPHRPLLRQRNRVHLQHPAMRL